MRIFSIIFAIFTLCMANAMSQPATFLKTYSNGNSGYAVRELNSNTYVVAGATDYYYNFNWMILSPIANTNIHLFKTTDVGTLLWEKRFELPLSRSMVIWEEITSDGGIILCGRTNKDLAWPPDSNDVILIKCDGDGNIQWSKKYDSGKDELGFCVRQTLDGGFAMSAFHDALPMSLSGTTYAMMIKTDASGNVEWNRSYEQAVRDLDTGEGLTWVFSQTADSGYVMTGTTVGAHQADIYVIRINKTGDVQWAKSYEHDNTVNRFSLGLDVIENNIGEIIIAAAMDKDHSNNDLNYPCILKLSSTGILIKAVIYNSIPAQSFQAGFSSVEESADGGYLFTGMGGYSGFGQQAQILKTDSDLNMDWSRSYTNDGNATIGARSGRSTSDGSYIFTGKKFNAGSVLLKTDFIGLVPCKNPASLIEITPGINTIDRFPGFVSGIVASNIFFNTLLSSIDTTTVCPVIFSHLPVELISFSGEYMENEKVLLEWQTASETNNDYFILEKSFDARTFTKTGIVKGNGNSTNLHSYSFIDRFDSNSMIVYYRLLQIDYDGKEQLSKTIAVVSKTNDFLLLKINAHRLNQRLNFQVASNGIEKLEFILMDAIGKIHIRELKNSVKGINDISIEKLNLTEGIYFFTINHGIQTISGKIFY